MALISVAEAAKELGVSARTVYTLAAPGGPIPCHRIGARILFSPDDLQQYLQSCRHTEIKRAVAKYSSSTVSPTGGRSELERYFREQGLNPRLTPTSGRRSPDTTSHGRRRSSYKTGEQKS